MAQESLSGGSGLPRRTAAASRGDPDGNFAVVYFRPTIDYADDDWTGHPENAVWFCAEHLPLTEELTRLTALEAIDQIRAQQPRGKA